MKILVAYDGTLNAKDVLRYGLYRIKTSGGELKVLHMLDDSSLKDYEEFDCYRTLADEAGRRLDEARKIIAESGKASQVELVSCECGLEQELIDCAQEGRFDRILVPQKFAGIARDSLSRVSVVPRDYSTFKVLVVDDEVAFANALSQRLNLKNFRTEVVTRGEQALEYIEKETPDIVLLDLRMPGMDGIDVLKNIKALYPEIQVIILSGHESGGDREEAIRYGAFDFVSKPADIELLTGKIKEAYWTKIERPAADFFADA
jgi:CheY-like chemotaxis protein